MLSFIQTAAFPAFFLVTLTSLVVLISHNWRWSLLFLGLQYVGTFTLTAQSWPLEMAAVKLVAGWMAAAVLGIGISEASSAFSSKWGFEEGAWPSSLLFRLLAASLILLSAYSISQSIPAWLPGISPAPAFGGLVLIGMGLLQLGLTMQPVRVAVGLLTVLSGFEIIYAAAETSALLAGLLAVIHLGLALVCTYIILAPGVEESE
jgi:hypothetical protein